MSTSLRFFFMGAVCLVSFSGVYGEVAEEEVDASTEGHDRYAKVVVSVKVEDNSFQTRRNAIAQAEEDALFLWIEALLGAQDRKAEHFFTNRIDGYVSSSKVLKERALTRGGELEVEVQLDTYLVRFDAAKLLFPRRSTPVSTVILMGEYLSDGGGYSVGADDVAPKMLRKLFKKSGFHLYPLSELNKQFSEAAQIECLQGGKKGALRLGRTLDAEIILFGETKSSADTPEEGGPAQVTGSADVLVIRVSDGQILERINTEAVVEGSNIQSAGLMAIEDAMYKAQNRILVAAALGSLFEPRREWIRLTIEGENVKNISDSLTEYLDSLDSIQSLELLHQQRNSLVYSVGFSGKYSALVKLLAEQARDVVLLEPIKIVDAEMTFRLVGY